MNIKNNFKQRPVILLFIFSLLYPLYPSTPSREISVVRFKQSPFKQLWMKTLTLEHKDRAPSSLSIISGANAPVKICWAIDRKINIFDLKGNKLTKEIKSPFPLETTFLTKDERTLVLIGKENIARLNLETKEIPGAVPLPLREYGPFQVTLKVKGENHYWIGGIIAKDKRYIPCLFIFTFDGMMKACMGVPVFPIAGVTESIAVENELVEVIWLWDFSEVICITPQGKGIYQYNSGLEWRFFLEPTRYHFQGICQIGPGEIAAVFMGPGTGVHLKSRLVRFSRRGGQVEARGEPLDYLYTCAASEDKRACFAGFRIKSTPPRIDVEAAASLVFDSQGKPVENLWESSALPVKGYYLGNRPCFLLTGGYAVVLDQAHMPLWQEETNLIGDWEFIPLDLDGDNKMDDFLVAGQNKSFAERHNLLAMVNQEEIVVKKALKAFQRALELLEKEKESWVPGFFREKEKQRILNAFREAASLFEQVDMQEHLQKARNIINDLENGLVKIRKLKQTFMQVLGGVVILLILIMVVRYRRKIRDVFLKAIENGTRQIMRIRMFNIPEVEDLYRSQDHLRDRLKQIKEKASQLEGDRKENILAEIPVLEREVNTLQHRTFYPRLSAKISRLETQMLQAGEEEEAALYQVPFQAANPAVYPVGRPINDLHLYCGRSHQLENLFQALAGKESMIVDGQYRIGKSSILRLTKKRLLGKFPCVYYDTGLLRSGRKGLNQWLNILGESCDKALDSRTFSQWKSQQSTKEMNAADIGQRFLQEWLYPLNQEKGNIIIMFDEFQHIIDTIDESTAGLLKHIVENSLLTFVFCVRTKASLPAEHRVFNSIRPLHLGQLEEDGIEELLTLPERLFGHRYSTAAKRRLKQLTGGHPYYLQVAHAVLAERLNAEKSNFLRETPHIDETTIYKILERLESHFRTEWMHLSGIERRIILELVHGRYTLSEAELFDRVYRGKNDLGKEFTAALYNLKDIMQIISITDQQYAVNLGLWSHWVRSQSPVELLQKKEV
jgi:hypothetical protein